MAETENRKLDPDEMFAALSKKISDSGMDMDMGRIEAAYNMAKLAHSGQLRKDGSPYVTHCVAAADIAADMGQRSWSQSISMWKMENAYNGH